MLTSWFKTWINYTGYKPTTSQSAYPADPSGKASDQGQPTQDGAADNHTRNGQRPGPIDNKHLSSKSGKLRCDASEEAGPRQRFSVPSVLLVRRALVTAWRLGARGFMPDSQAMRKCVRPTNTDWRAG